METLEDTEIDLKERAREMREIQGLSIAEIAGQLGIKVATVDKWARRDNWAVPRTVRHLVVNRQTIKQNLPTLEAALQTLYKQDKATKEKAFDEHLHDIACAVPYIIKQMPADEWVTKADKVVKLVAMAREILGKQDKKEQRPLVNIGILSGNLSADKRESVQLIEAE
jgi:transcriptional regulator with XRE-family HTH domain